MTILSDYVKAAEILGVVQNALHKWAAERKLSLNCNPTFGYRLLRRADLNGFLRKMTQPAKPSPPRKPR